MPPGVNSGMLPTSMSVARNSPPFALLPLEDADRLDRGRVRTGEVRGKGLEYPIGADTPFQEILMTRKLNLALWIVWPGPARSGRGAGAPWPWASAPATWIREPSEVTAAEVREQLDRAQRAASAANALLDPSALLWLANPTAAAVEFSSALVSAFSETRRARSPRLPQTCCGTLPPSCTVRWHQLRLAT